MPENIESMFSVREMPWHREGTILADYPGSWDQARKLAGLDWDPIATEVYALTDLDADGNPRYEPIEGWKCVARSDNGAVLSLNRRPHWTIRNWPRWLRTLIESPNAAWGAVCRSAKSMLVHATPASWKSMRSTTHSMISNASGCVSSRHRVTRTF